MPLVRFLGSRAKEKMKIDKSTFKFFSLIPASNMNFHEFL